MSWEAASAGQDALRTRLEKARDEGELIFDAAPDDLARYFATVFQGIAVQAAGGASREELHRVADLAMRALPQDSEQDHGQDGDEHQS